MDLNALIGHFKCFISVAALDQLVCNIFAPDNLVIALKLLLFELNSKPRTNCTTIILRLRAAELES